jgi:hypothetical protein
MPKKTSGRVASPARQPPPKNAIAANAAAERPAPQRRANRQPPAKASAAWSRIAHCSAT